MVVLPTVVDSPGVLMVYPSEWLERAREEWEILSRAAVSAGLTVVVTHWEAVSAVAEQLSVANGYVSDASGRWVESLREIRCRPTITLTPWGVGPAHTDLFRLVVERSQGNQELPARLAQVARKAGLERMLRNYERSAACTVERPRTRLSSEIREADLCPPNQYVIVKPNRGKQCKGIGIVRRSELPLLVADAKKRFGGEFVIQALVRDQPLYNGRRWDARIYALATQLRPLRYCLYKEGVAKTTAAPATPGGSSLDEWLNADSYAKDRLPAENLLLSEMLSYVCESDMVMDDFWTNSDRLVHSVFASMALVAEEEGIELGKAFVLLGVDVVLERIDANYRLCLLEANIHPGFDWSPSAAAAGAPEPSSITPSASAGVNAALLPTYVQVFRDLLGICTGAEPQ